MAASAVQQDMPQVVEDARSAVVSVGAAFQKDMPQLIEAACLASETMAEGPPAHDAAYCGMSSFVLRGGLRRPHEIAGQVGGGPALTASCD